MSSRPHYTSLEDISDAMRRVVGDTTVLTPHEQEGELLKSAWEQAVRDYSAAQPGTPEYRKALDNAMEVMRARAKHREGGQGHFELKV